MINIFYNGNTILASDLGIPVRVVSYWNSEFNAGIQAAFDAGNYEVIPEFTPPPP